MRRDIFTMSKLNDSWQTPQWLFDLLDGEFNFDIDLCATESNSKCDNFCHDYLKDIIGRKGSNCIGCFQEETKQGLIQSAFMNPPYSRPTKTNPGINAFIEKAWEDSKHCKIVCLVKCDPSTKWWATFWNYEDVIWPTSGITAGVYSKIKEKRIIPIFIFAFFLLCKNMSKIR